MKRVIMLRLCVFLFFGVAAVAQNNTFLKSSMVVLVNEAKGTFVKGTNYKDWLMVQIGNATPNVQEEKLFKDVYGFLSTGSNSEAIFKNYDGTSLTALAKVKSTVVLSQSNAKCGLWCSIVRFLIDLVIELDNIP